MTVVEMAMMKAPRMVDLLAHLTDCEKVLLMEAEKADQMVP